MRTKFLIFDGVDEVGKSTFISQVKEAVGDKVVELNFPKLLPVSNTLLRINDEKSFELLFAVFDYLDPTKTYILDRFIPSNLVYDKVLRNEEISLSEYYWKMFKQRFDVKTYIFTRPEIDHDFVDDKIKMSRDAFNACIREYHNYGTNHMLLIRDNQGGLVGPDKHLRYELMCEIEEFIHG